MSDSVNFGEVTRSVQHRCPNMRRHYDYGKDDRRHLPRPCPDCYSLIVTAEVVPHRHDERWSPLSWRRNELPSLDQP